VHKLDQSELQLDRSQLSYPKHLGLSIAGGNSAQNHKRPTTFKLATPLESWEIDRDRR